MLKRIAAAITAAAVLPLFYLFLVGRGGAFTLSDSVADEMGYRYTLLYDLDELLLVKSDGGGDIVGKWRTARADGYNYISADAMQPFGGELYCVLSEINSKDFTILRRRWLRINFESGSAEAVCEKEYGDIQNAYSTSLTVSDGKITTVSSLIEGIMVTDVCGGTEYVLDPPTDAVVNYAAALDDGRIVCTDVLNGVFVADAEGNSRRIYEADRAGSFCGFSVSGDGRCSAYDPVTGEYLIGSVGANSDEMTFAAAEPPETAAELDGYREIFGGRFWVCCAAGLAAGAAVFALLSLKRFPVLLKLAAITVMCLGIGGASLFALINSIMERLHLERNLEKALLSADMIGAEIDAERFEDIDWSSPEGDAYFYELAELVEYSGESRGITSADDGSYTVFGDKNYCWIYPVTDGEIRSGICDQNPVNLPLEAVAAESLLSPYRQVAEGRLGAAACGIADDSFDWVLAVSPLKNSDNEIIALVETGISKLNYTTRSRENSADILRVVVIFETVTGALILAAAGFALLPLKRLHGAVEAAGNGDYGVSVKVRGRDEIAGIAKAFNVMSLQIYEHTQNLGRLNEAYLRFLPSGIISSIGKSSVLSVSRGDYSRISGYILHIALLDFAERTAGMPNDDVFELINDISREIMENIIGKNGVIESYNQEEYICIFGDADSAYGSAVELIRRLRELFPRLKTAFAIVRDSMLLGIVGHEKRLGTIMLSHGIGLSKKLCRIASVCGANLLVTSDVSFSAPCPRRLLGRIGFDGREYEFFDCFAGDEISAYLSKLDGCARFEEMVGQFLGGNWSECRRSALAYLEKHKNDPAAIRYLFLCEDNIKKSEEKGMESVI